MTVIACVPLTLLKTALSKFVGAVPPTKLPELHVPLVIVPFHVTSPAKAEGAESRASAVTQARSRRKKVVFFMGKMRE